MDESTRLLVGSWNVLAEGLAHEGLYPNARRGWLKGESRRDSITLVIAESGADVVGLQEIEPWLVERLEGYGQLVWAKRKTGRGDGVGVFVREGVAIDDIEPIAVFSGSEYIKAGIKVSLSGDGVKFDVVSAHLTWGEEEGPKKPSVREISRILAGLGRQTRVVLVGDTNARSGEIERGLIKQAGFTGDANVVTGWVNGGVIAVDVIMGRGVDLGELEVVGPAGELPRETWPSDHLMLRREVVLTREQSNLEYGVS